jgi:hypothetical protein
MAKTTKATPERWSNRPPKPPWPRGYEVEKAGAGWAYWRRIPNTKPKQREYRGKLSGAAWEELKNEPIEFQKPVITALLNDRAGNRNESSPRGQRLRA